MADETGKAGGRQVLVVGSLNMDLVMRVPRVPEAGETLTGHEFFMVPGGKGANQAVACARLGARVAQIGRVGADAFGRVLRDGLARDGIDHRHVTTDDAAATGVAVIAVEEAGRNRIMLAPGANATLSAAQLDTAAAAFRRAALTILQLEVPLSTVEHAVGLATRAGCPVLLNPAPAQAVPASLWPSIDYLVPNENEAALLTGIAVTDPRSAGEAALKLLGLGVRRVLLTLGEQGVLIAAPEGVRHLPAQKADAIDTTAAGDTFIGGFAVGLLEGLALDQAAGLGQRAAAVCVARRGAQPSIPYRREL
jgi:ribokinase